MSSQPAEVPKALWWGLSGDRGCGVLGIPHLASDLFSLQKEMGFFVVVDYIYIYMIIDKEILTVWRKHVLHDPIPYISCVHGC